MLALRERTKIRLARLAFVALGLLPLVAVATATAALHSDAYRRWHQESARQVLGVAATVEHVRHPRPALTLYEGVQVYDAETGRLLLRARLVEIDRRGATPLVRCTLPEVSARAASRLSEVVVAQLRRQPHARQHAWRWVANELTVHFAEQSQTLTDLVGELTATARQSTLTARFYLAGATTGQPAQLEIVRDRQTVPPSHLVALDTGGHDVPGLLLSTLADWPAWLGQRCQFRGWVKAVETPAGWDAHVAGRLDEADLEQLVSGHFPQRLTGRARVDIQEARVSRGRLEQARGTLSAGPGTIGRALVEAAAHSLALPRGEPPDAGDLWTYDELALAFHMTDGELRLSGTCRDEAGAVLMAAGQPLLSEPAAPQSVAGLIRTLAPGDDWLVPASRESDWLLSVLPTPRLAERDDSSPHTARPHVHVRFGRALSSPEDAPDGTWRR